VRALAVALAELCLSVALSVHLPRAPAGPERSSVAAMFDISWVLGTPLNSDRPCRSGRVSRHNRIVLFPWSALQRSRLWPDSSVAARLTFEQRPVSPSEIKKHVARLPVRQGPTSHLPLHDDNDNDRQTPSRSL
jgi:hypothetical protein